MRSRAHSYPTSFRSLNDEEVFGPLSFCHGVGNTDPVLWTTSKCIQLFIRLLFFWFLRSWIPNIWQSLLDILAFGSFGVEHNFHCHGCRTQRHRNVVPNSSECTSVHCHFYLCSEWTESRICPATQH